MSEATTQTSEAQASEAQASEAEAGEAGAPKRRPFWIMLPLLGFLGLAVLFYMQLFAGDHSRIPSALINKHVPEFTLPPIRGDEGGLASADLEKGVHVVNVWASWCGPCRLEHDTLLELSKDKRFTLVGINYKDQAENALRFMGVLGDPYAEIGADRTGTVAIDWGVYGVPETFIVRDGIITYKFIGPLSEESVKKDFMPALEKALKGEVPPPKVSSSSEGSSGVSSSPAPAKRGAGSGASASG
jgi:cytochrome c biogenesis protein CcmG/thiol:disulfide interchange protein DsbE